MAKEQLDLLIADHREALSRLRSAARRLIDADTALTAAQTARAQADRDVDRTRDTLLVAIAALPVDEERA